MQFSFYKIFSANVVFGKHMVKLSDSNVEMFVAYFIVIQCYSTLFAIINVSYSTKTD